MTRLLLLCLVLAFSAPALAQRGAPTPASTAARAGDGETAKLTSAPGGCARPGGILTLGGVRLSRAPGLAPAIKISGRLVALPVLSRAEDRFVVRLSPHDGLEPGKVYDIVLAGRDGAQQGPALPLRLCPRMAAAREEDGARREILIMAAAEEEGPIRAFLEEAGIPVLETDRLPALGSVIFVIGGGDLQSLRARLPQAAVDWNDDLRPAAAPRLYARDKINWPARGDCLPEKGTVKIGLIDGAIDRAHDAFRGQRITARDFTGGRADTAHGTAIASILAGNAPDKGFDGVLKGQDIYNAVVLRAGAQDAQRAAARAVVAGLDWLVGENVRLVNLSLATGRNNRVLERGVDGALDRGALVFAAAGNAGPRAPPAYPAALDRVMAVTATDAAGRLYKQANRGAYIDFAAPGVDIWVAVPGNGGGYRSGTSYAVPYALATAALHLRNNPAMPRDVLIRLMQSRGDTAPGAISRVSAPCARE